MNLNEAYDLTSRPEPEPEDHVNIFCPNCDGKWVDDVCCIFTIGDEHRTYFRNYVGNENFKEDDKGNPVIVCPNGCTDIYTEDRTELLRFDSIGRADEWHRWKYATLVVELDKLDRRSEEIKREMRCCGSID